MNELSDVRTFLLWGLTGRNPSNINLSARKPDTLNAVITAKSIQNDV